MNNKLYSKYKIYLISYCKDYYFKEKKCHELFSTACSDYLEPNQYAPTNQCID